MSKRDFHKEVRVIYRACRRIYGKERTQDECLKVFKVVFAEICRLKKSENERELLSDGIRDKLQKSRTSFGCNLLLQSPRGQRKGRIFRL